MDGRLRRGVLAVAVATLAAGALAVPAQGYHGRSTYLGHYGNAFVAGETTDGREVALMGGWHVDFPYHHADSNYDEIAVFVQGAQPFVLTGKPTLAGFDFEPGAGSLRLAYEGPGRATFDLRLAAVRHPDRYQGDPADLGDMLHPHAPEDMQRPGLIYTPLELTGLVDGSLVLDGEPVELASLHGQAELGELDAPADRRFETGYDYLAAPTLPASNAQYTFMGFDVRGLHPGADGAFGPYFHATASDEFTMEGGELGEGNPNGAPAPFDNRNALPPGAAVRAAWATDLGPGILNRKLVRTEDASGRPLLVLSETVVRDEG